MKLSMFLAVMCCMLMIGPMMVGCYKKQIVKQYSLPQQVNVVKNKLNEPRELVPVTKIYDTNGNLVGQSTDAPFEITGWFDYDSANLNDIWFAWIGSRIMDLQGKPLIVEGHCDERGTEAYNLCLGERRAERVKEYLKFMGIKDVEVISYGKEKPAVLGHDEAAWSKNRRAVIKIRK